MSGARLVRTLALAAVASVALAGCGGGSGTTSSGPTGGGDAAPQVGNAADPKGDGKAQCTNAEIAYIGTINGANAGLGIAIRDGAKTAVTLHNNANPGCKVTLREFDTEGSPDKAPGVVTQAINSPNILGVVGPAFSGESKAVGAAFNNAGLVAITPSATNPSLSKNGWKTFFRGLGHDNLQGPVVSKYITETLKASKVCVIRDASEYGVGLGDAVEKALGDKVTCKDSVKAGQTEFSAVVGKVVSAKPDVVFYSGYYDEGAPLAAQIKDKGVTAKIVGPDGIKDLKYVSGAGDGAEGTLMTCPCVPSDNFAEFVKAYKEVSGGPEPATYSPEAYDAATIFLKGIDKGIKDRAGLLAFVKAYEGQGLSKKFKWDATGELTETPYWSYKVEKGKIIKQEDISKYVTK